MRSKSHQYEITISDFVTNQQLDHYAMDLDITGRDINEAMSQELDTWARESLHEFHPSLELEYIIANRASQPERQEIVT